MQYFRFSISIQFNSIHIYSKGMSQPHQKRHARNENAAKNLESAENNTHIALAAVASKLRPQIAGFRTLAICTVPLIDP